MERSLRDLAQNQLSGDIPRLIYRILLLGASYVQKHPCFCRLGMQMFDGGCVHHGLLKATEMIRELLNKEKEKGNDYELVFIGHSLRSGVAALMTIIVVNHRQQFGRISREKIKCYALAPARCMSLNRGQIC